MSNISQLLDSIIATRNARLQALNADISVWRAQADELDTTLRSVEAAERVNPELAGISARLKAAKEQLKNILASAANVRARVGRDTLCIGIGGAAGMGKSTLLQSITGLADEQIPTGAKYFTTAVRSLIENSAHENTAIAEFHSEESFLREVITPLCDEIKITAPTNLNAFQRAQFELPDGTSHTQETRDILKRLQDAQSHLQDYVEYLTGECGKRIELAELKKFVAYPEPKDDGVIVKAGPYLAVKNLIIRVPFPSTNVARLRVVDLPGLGEAGLNLAKIQTAGLADVCDVTFLVKRPGNERIEWTDRDTNALDAMSKAVPLLDDQTKYTAILANVGNSDSEDQIKVIRGALKPREFEIISCNAIDRDSVVHDTMPKILAFLAENLPKIDEAIISRLHRDAEIALDSVRRDVAEVTSRVRTVAPAGTGDYDFAKKLNEAVVSVLVEQERIAKSNIGEDKEWNDEVMRIHDAVRNWVLNGCGYESKDALLAEIRREIEHKHAQPVEVINECRVKFRNEWEAMDMHLASRITKLLAGIMDALAGVLNDFVPRRDADTLDAVRAQIIDFADRIDARTLDVGDDEALRELSRPLRRIAEFDLQFRFHLEPMLHATTHLLVAKELPQTQYGEDAENFHKALEEKLLAAVDDYASGMRKTAASNNALERKKKIFEKAIPDASVRADAIGLLEQAMSSAQSFCPNRIFAAVVETFADAFTRSKNSDKAFQILAREWRDELSPAPDEKTRLTNAAAGSLAELSKNLNAAGKNSRS